MHSVEGTFTQGVIQLDEAVEGREGQRVLITFLNSEESEEKGLEEDTLGQLIEACGVETGVSDLAHEHDHYLHSKPRRES